MTSLSLYTGGMSEVVASILASILLPGESDKFGPACCDSHHYAAMQMEGMVTDLQLARDKQQQFEEWRTNQNKSLKIDLIVTVLTTGFWPSYKVHIWS